ncbi:MAG: helix-turn-helix domain-containing protein [Dehalococcoidia bacterium]|nr:helix-turn-helix domain-containing protein [Dehalococcoidia bacterium]
MQKKPYNQECPIARTLDIVGDRWTLLIVRDLFLGRARFSTFLDSCPGLPPRLLSGRLKRLEEQGLVERTVYSQHPLRAEYRLTEKGRTLFPILRAIGEWGLEHLYEDNPETGRSIERFVKSLVPEFQES